MSDFSELLQKAEQLSADFGAYSTSNGVISDSGPIRSDLPRVERSLKQLVETGQQLFSKTKGHAGINLGSQDVKASVLLGSRGVDLPGMATKLGTLTAAVSGSEKDRSFTPIEPVRDTDVAGFLKNERENAILAVIEETRSDTFENAERLHWESSLNEWEAEKQRIINDLSGGIGGFNGSQNLLDYTELLAPKIQLSRVHDSTLGVRSHLNASEMAYASKVMKYNESVVNEGLRPELSKEFNQLFTEETDQEGARIWEMVEAMMQGIPKLANYEDPKEVVNGRINISTSKAIIAAAKKYLEAAFLRHMNYTVFSNFRKAELGGIPGTYHLVRSYLNVMVAPDTPGLEDGNIEGIGSSADVPIWPLIYFCLRCGDLDAAIKAANVAGSGLAEILKLLNEVKGSADGRLSTHTENVIQIAYKRTYRSCTDPYKRAVYCILGACDPNEEHSEVATSLDDYLWMKLSQIREIQTTESAQRTPENRSRRTLANKTDDTLSLSQLQNLLSEEYGENHFNAFEQPVLYFQVLLLSGQFETACDFLFRVGGKYQGDAVHIAIALYESQILLVPSNVRCAMLTTVFDNMDGMNNSPMYSIRKLNIARLIMLYVKKFEVTDPREALNYFFILRKLKAPTVDGEKTRSGDSLFTRCVSELVLESREYNVLLGHILDDGSRAPGLIDKFGNSIGNNLPQAVVKFVAEDSERKGMFEDSIQLYDLANNQEKVIELFNKLLAQVVSAKNVTESRRDRLQRQAVVVARRYRLLGHDSSNSPTASFYLLLDLMTFFDAINNGLNKEALDIISKMKIVPLCQADIDTMVATFRLMTDEVRRIIPDVLLATMNLLFNKYRTSKVESSTGVLAIGVKSSFGTSDGGKGLYLERLRDQAKSIITFAGMIPYRMPGDTNARLVEMEVQMN